MVLDVLDIQDVVCRDVTPCSAVDWHRSAKPHLITFQKTRATFQLSYLC